MRREQQLDRNREGRYLCLFCALNINLIVAVKGLFIELWWSCSLKVRNKMCPLITMFYCWTINYKRNAGPSHLFTYVLSWMNHDLLFSSLIAAPLPVHRCFNCWKLGRATLHFCTIFILWRTCTCFLGLYTHTHIHTQNPSILFITQSGFD